MIVSIRTILEGGEGRKGGFISFRSHSISLRKAARFPLTNFPPFQLFELSFGPGTVLVPLTIGLGVAGGHLDSQLRA